MAVEYCGLCGTDLEEYLEGPINVPQPPHPVVLGHEIVGRVAQAAADGSGPPEGSRVVPDVVRGCGRCYWCVRHEEGQCPQLRVSGLHLDGGLAEYFCAPGARCVVVPEHVPAEEAVIVEPLSVAVRAARKAGSLLGASLVVVGCGTIGLLVVAVGRATGASCVVAVDPVKARRDIATEFGADAAVPPDQGREATLRFTGARGADVVAECSGAKGGVGRALELVRNGGQCVLVGFHPGTEEFKLLDVVLSEKQIVGSAAHMWDDDVVPAVGLAAGGQVKLGRLVSHRVPLSDVVEAFELLASRDAATLKVVVKVS